MYPKISLSIQFEADGEKRRVDVDASGDAWPAQNVRELNLVTRRRGSSWLVEVTPERSVTVQGIRAAMACDVRGADAIYLNGYESWTDSFERSPWAAMPGLARVPRPLVKKYQLDWSGDYRFTREDPLPGHQHGFGYGYLRYGSQVLLFGSLNEDDGFTTIREDAARGRVTFEKEPPACPLEAGNTRELMGLWVDAGALEDMVGAWLAAAGTQALPANKVIGYTSWYRHYNNIDWGLLQGDLDALAAVVGQVPHEGADVLFQVDDGYAKVGDWMRPDTKTFPQGMAPLADAAHEKGMLAGLWMAPFICEKESALAEEHPDWILGAPGAEGATFNWSGALVLDLLKPEVREYVAECLRTATSEWGFDLLKLDFLFAACMVARAGRNRGELMADAIALIRESVAPGTRLLLCGVPLTSAFGKCEYCRVGCDVGLDWDDKPHMRLLHRERVSTKMSLADARGRAHLDGRAFGCDPDVFFLRDDVELTDAQRAQMLGTDVKSGHVLLTSDDMGAWDAAQLAQYHALVKEFLRS
ncbi:glycoside hydrolase family 36 protein [Paratractidigestivibacter sp.]|uniref:glycoside hydrolase family 36 protein n=1 Tax=Paratractidigestivibacter sp. TaxID=2847316 RepID=UPI002ABE6537|nr:glycoside hydrolase family 36 protein [Paratractidigestivibacter sp.]